MDERRIELRAVHSRNAEQHVVGEFTAYDRCDLRHRSPLWRSVQARHERVAQSSGTDQEADGSARWSFVPCSSMPACRAHTTREFFYEEWYGVALVDDPFHHRGRDCLLTQRQPHHLGHVAPRRTGYGKRTQIAMDTGARLILWPMSHDEENARLLDSPYNEIKKLLRRRIDPLRVLEQTENRALCRETEQQVDEHEQGLDLHLHGGEPKRGIPRWQWEPTSFLQ